MVLKLQYFRQVARKSCSGTLCVIHSDIQYTNSLNINVIRY